MEDLIIVAGIVVAIVLLRKKSAAQMNTLPAPPPVPTADAIPYSSGVSSAPSVSGGYQTLPTGFVRGVSSAASSPSYISPNPVSAPPPPFYGGLAGGAGSGGNPLGGVLRAGVSGGTGTTTYREPTANRFATDPNRLNRTIVFA